MIAVVIHVVGALSRVIVGVVVLLMATGVVVEVVETVRWRRTHPRTTQRKALPPARRRESAHLSEEDTDTARQLIESAGLKESR